MSAATIRRAGATRPRRIRLFGPADTVAFYRKGFEDWVKAFK
jgi:hypothetical protein